MDKFMPVRHSGNSNTPVRDGQMLVDKSTGLVSWDIGGSRIQPTNVYGITYSVDINQWIQVGSKYYIDITDTDINIPNGFSVIGAQIVGHTQQLEVVSNKVYSSIRLSGTLLVSTIPGELSNNPEPAPTDFIYYGYITDNSISGVGDITADHIKQLKASPVVEGAVRISDIPAGAFTVVVVPTAVKMTVYKRNCCNPTDKFITNTGSTITGSNGTDIIIDDVAYKVYGELNLIKTTTVVVVKSAEDGLDAGYVDGVLYTLAGDGEYVSEELTPMGYNALTVSKSAADGVYVYDDLTGVWSK